MGAGKAYDTKDFLSTVRELNVTPHINKNDKVRTSVQGAEKSEAANRMVDRLM